MPKTVREIAVAYNKAAALYDLMNRVYFFGRDRLFRSRLAKSLRLKPGDAALDLCCGTGLDFPFLLRKIENQGTLLGVDLSSEMLQQAKKKVGVNGVSLVRSDAAHLAFRDRTFDAVLVSFCLKITPANEKTLEEMARVLKPTGRIGVLGNHKPFGYLWPLGIVLMKILSAVAKIDFELDLEEHLSKKFVIIEDRKMHGDLVRFLVGENRLA